MAETRIRKPDSLATMVAEMLAEFEVPVPTEVVRVLATERRGAPVTAEQLGRIAAYERKSLLTTNLPPLLCQAIDRRGLALRPRQWALGDWRLARRIATPDIGEKWQAQIATVLITEILMSSRSASEEFTGLTAEAISRVLGPIGVYLPGPREQWEDFQAQIRRDHWDWSPAGITGQQMEAERALRERELPAVSLFFGSEVSVLARSNAYDPVHLRLADEGELGRPFDQIALDRLEGDADRLRALLAYLQGWSHLRDDLGRAPSSEEFASRWQFDAASVAIDEEVFQAAFPEEQGPERIIRMLEEGLPRSGQLAWMMGVEVVDEQPRQDAVRPSRGQRWYRHDGAELVVTHVDGPAVIGRLETRDSTEIWAADRAKLLREFQPPNLPADLWLVRFEVDVLPRELLEPLSLGGFAPTRLARPGNPRPDGAMRAGLVEAQVIAPSADQARSRVLQALPDNAGVSREAIQVRQLATAEAGARFEIKTKRGGYFWRMSTSDGQWLLESEGYATKGSAARSVDIARSRLVESLRQAGLAAKWVEHNDGGWSWVVYATNGQRLAGSPQYETREQCEEAMVAAQGQATAPTVDVDAAE